MYALRALGHEADITENKFRHNTRHIIFGAHLLSPDSSFPPDTILYNLEQVAGGNIGHLLILGGKYTIWDYAKPNCDEWAKRRIQAVHVPIGYVPEISRIKPREQDIDVLFYGSMNERRAAIMKELKRRGLNRVGRVNDCYGEELDELIARSKVILNVHYYESKIFEIVRVGYALANKKAVVSEESVDDYHQLLGGLVVRPYDEIVDACMELVNDPINREYLGLNGWRVYSEMKETDILSSAIGVTVESR